MMASGKKGKKTKGKTLALNDFLQETGGSLPSQPIRKSTKSWADELDDYDAIDPKSVNIALPTAPKASRDYDDIASKVPKDPPYIAYLSNLPYDIDEEEIVDFFGNLKVKDMKMPKAEKSGEGFKLRGFGYVEFEDRESLIGALDIRDATIKTRRIRIEVADNDDRKKRSGMMGDRPGSSDTGGDWRSTNRPEPIEPVDRRGGRGFSREGGSSTFTREGMRDSNKDRNRDFGRDRDSGYNRDGGFNRNRDQDDRPGAWRDGDRDNRGFSRPSYRDGRDEREDRRGGGFRRYDDKEERNGGFTRSSNRGDRDDRDPEASNSEPRRRPKLQLAPRTKPLEESNKIEPAVPSASIFGNAKPVDTTEKERQVEEKLKQQDERLRESSKDSRDKDWGEEGGDRRNYERGRPRRDDRDGNSRRDENSHRNEDSHRDEEIRSRDRGPPSKDRGPSSSDKRPSSRDRRPSSRDRRPSSRDRRPSSRDRRPSSKERSPSSKERRPSSKERRPSSKERRPSSKERRPSSKDRRNASGEDNRRKGDRSPDRKKNERHDKDKKKQEFEMPKFQEPEAPNFQGSNKFAVLDDNSE